MEKFIVKHNTVDRETIEAIAIERGFKNTREFINSELREFPKRFSGDMACKNKKQSFQNIYIIPEELEDFYTRLACLHSTTVSTIIYRYIIFAHIADRLTK